MLMSCRVLGKGIEEAFIREVIKNVGYSKLKATYIPTEKNGQVAEFYDKIGFTSVMTEQDGAKHYEVEVNKLDLTIKDYYKFKQ